MSVIGRLDKQVADVLITPVGENSSREGADADDGQARPAATRRRDSSATREREPAARERVEDAHVARQPRRDRRAHGDEPLPVWLL